MPKTLRISEASACDVADHAALGVTILRQSAKLELLLIGRPLPRRIVLKLAKRGAFSTVASRRAGDVQG
jgi:hypothetical protein